MGEWLSVHSLELVTLFLLYKISVHLESLAQRRSAWDTILEGIGDSNGLSLWDINQVRSKFGLERVEWQKKDQ